VERSQTIEGSPWENTYSETFISRFSAELLKREMFTGLIEAKVLVEEYRNHHNHQLPHSSVGYRTPVEFAGSGEPTSTENDFTEELESLTALPS